jgi:hypothetical protein
LKLVDHGEPLLLLGADVLRGGRPPQYWCFDSIGIRSVINGEGHGYINFIKEGK